MIPYAIRKKYHIFRGEMNAVLIKKNLDITKVKEENIISNFTSPIFGV